MLIALYKIHYPPSLRVTHLGSLPMAMEEKQAVLRDREEAQNTYQVLWTTIDGRI